MKKILPLLLLPVYLFAQPGLESITNKIKRVENSLNPSLIFGDSLPNSNLQQRMQETRTKGLSIAVIDNFRIVWAGAYGWADSAEGRKVNLDTRFQAASISKSINSLGILKLIQQGRIDTSADINQYLKRWKFPYDSLSKGKKITILDLLSHTASLTVHGFRGYNRKDIIPDLVRVLDGLRPANSAPVRSFGEPRKRFQYSGGGTTISQLMLEDITGKKYAVWMEKNILKPLGMKNSSFRQPPADTSNLATGYYGNAVPVNGKFHVYPEQAAAGLWTTPSDLARYIIDCQLTLSAGKGKIVTKELMENRMTPRIDTNVALGVFLVQKGKTKWFNHNGGNEAFLCTSWGSLEGGKGAVIMINGEDFTVINELLNSVALAFNWEGFYTPEFRKTVMVPADTLKLYCGNYKMGKDTITLTMNGNKLVIQQNGEPARGYTAWFADFSHFSIAEEPNAVFTVLRNANGEVEALELKDNRMKMKLPKMD